MYVSGITFMRYAQNLKIGIPFIRYVSGITLIISRYNISNMAAHCDNVTAI
jgi:hypothetical protein